MLSRRTFFKTNKKPEPSASLTDPQTSPVPICHVCLICLSQKQNNHNKSSHINHHIYRINKHTFRTLYGVRKARNIRSRSGLSYTNRVCLDNGKS